MRFKADHKGSALFEKTHLSKTACIRGTGKELGEREGWWYKNIQDVVKVHWSRENWRAEDTPRRNRNYNRQWGKRVQTKHLGPTTPVYMMRP